MLTHIIGWPGLPEVPPRLILSGLLGGDISSACFFSAHGKGTSARVWDAELYTYYFLPISSHPERTVGACLQHFCFNQGNVEHCATLKKDSVVSLFSPYLMTCAFSLEGLMLKLKLQYVGHLMQRAESLEKILSWERLRAGGEGGGRGWDGWMASLTQ